MREINPPLKLSARILQSIGRVAVAWSGIEAALEIAICGLYQIDFGRGLVLTANIGFQSRLALLRILAHGGAISDVAEAKTCLELLSAIEKGYAARNTVIHASWGPSKMPGRAKRLYIRAKGKTLRAVTEEVSEREIESVADQIEDLASDWLGLMDRLNLWGAAQFDAATNADRT